MLLRGNELPWLHDYGAWRYYLYVNNCRLYHPSESEFRWHLHWSRTNGCNRLFSSGQYNDLFVLLLNLLMQDGDKNE